MSKSKPLPAPELAYAVIERFPGGTNVLLHKSIKSAVKRFNAILEENLDPDMSKADRKWTLKRAAKKHYWETGNGDPEQEIVLELRAVSYED